MCCYTGTLFLECVLWDKVFFEKVRTLGQSVVPANTELVVHFQSAFSVLLECVLLLWDKVLLEKVRALGQSMVPSDTDFAVHFQSAAEHRPGG